jgi:hypothetical protein
MDQEQRSYAEQANFLKRIKFRRTIVFVLAVLTIPITLIINSLGIPIQFILIWFVIFGIYSLMVGLTRCPHCGGFFFFRGISSGGLFWFVNKCQKCGFPQKV